MTGAVSGSPRWGEVVAQRSRPCSTIMAWRALGGGGARLSGCTGWYFRVDVRVRLLRGEFSTCASGGGPGGGVSLGGLCLLMVK